jgi:hypothetical protein
MSRQDGARLAGPDQSYCVTYSTYPRTGRVRRAIVRDDVNARAEAACW